MCENGLRMRKTCPTFIQLENITELESFKFQKKKKRKKKQPIKSSLCSLVTRKREEEGKVRRFLITGGFDLENAPQNSVQKRGFVLLLIKIKLLLNSSGFIKAYI